MSSINNSIASIYEEQQLSLQKSQSFLEGCQQEQSSIKKNVSSTYYLHSSFESLDLFKKETHSQLFKSKRNNDKQLSLNQYQLIEQMNDVKQFTQKLKKLQELKQNYSAVQQKSTEMESYLNNLKIKVEENIKFFEEYSSFWMKKIIENQINKEILNHSFDYQKEIQSEKEFFILEINQIRQEIKNILVKLRDVPIVQDICQKYQMKLLNKYSNEQINYSNIELIFSEEEINSSLSNLPLSESECEIETSESISNICFEHNNSSDAILKEQVKSENFRLKVAFAGVNQLELFKQLQKQQFILKDSKSFIDQNSGVVAFSTAVILVSTKVPGIDLISLGCLGLVQSIVNFSNPHRSLSSCLRQQKVLLSQITLCGGFGLAGAAIGQAIIPVPILGAVVGGLVMEFLGIYFSMKIKEWTISEQIKDQMNFFAENNAEVNEQNLSDYYQVLDIKKESLTDKILLPNQQLLNKLLGNERQIETEQPFGDIEKVQIYLVYCLQSIGSKIFKDIKEVLGEKEFNLHVKLLDEMESYTEYFDFDYLSIGKNLVNVYNQLQEKISHENLKKIIEEIDPFSIDGNNLVVQQQESIKKYCKYQNLAEILKQNNIDESIILENIPESIQNLNSSQKLDLWSTFICIQLLNPSYVLLDIFMMKVNFQLESKNLLFIDTIDQYYPIIKKMFQDI